MLTILETGVVLWRTTSGLRCTFVRHRMGLPFEVTIVAGSTVSKRRRFERDEDAFTFAVAEMHEAFRADTAELV
jgi:hypothetical protein